MSKVILVSAETLERNTLSALREAGADEPSAAAATRAMMHAARLGVDSHSVRLTPHYAQALKGGRVNGRPEVTVRRTAAATAIVDADNALGHLAAYRGMEVACEIAGESGIGAVGIVRSSHYGAAGAYALAGAEAGFIAVSTTNTDSAVQLFGGGAAFHGTNPIAAAAPVPGQKPWLFDMATSSIPFNRVLLFRALGKALPEEVAADRAGTPTTDAELARMLIPLGGAGYGYKGAGLAGFVTILSAVLTGQTLDHLFIPMSNTDDFKTPRLVGHFCLAIDPEKFAGRPLYDAAITRYLAGLRASTARPGETVMAPGDREWAVEKVRGVDGIPIDAETARFLKLL